MIYKERIKELKKQIARELEYLSIRELESLLSMIKQLTKGIKSYKGIIERKRDNE